MANYDKPGRNVDQSVAALLKNLKSRGMLEDTIIAWTTEFERTPFYPAPNVEGRGCHARVYSSWLAGGGIKGGVVYGAGDERGEEAAENVISVHDYQATILNQFGLDHEKLTYRHAGRDFRLTDVHGKALHEIIA